MSNWEIKTETWGSFTSALCNWSPYTVGDVIHIVQKDEGKGGAPFFTSWPFRSYSYLTNQHLQKNMAVLFFPFRFHFTAISMFMLNVLSSCSTVQLVSELKPNMFTPCEEQSWAERENKLHALTQIPWATKTLPFTFFYLHQDILHLLSWTTPSSFETFTSPVAKSICVSRYLSNPAQRYIAFYSGFRSSADCSGLAL